MCRPSGISMLAVIAVIAVLVVDPRAARADTPGEALVVIVARGSKLKNLSKSELRRCFLAGAVTVGGERLVPFNLPAGTRERIAFDQSVLQLSPEQMGRFWVDRKIRGDSSAPRSLPTSLHVTKVVAKFPSAIGYVRADQVTDEVVAITIDGTASTSTAYPIRLR